MSTITINGATLGNGLQTLLMADDIVPGAEPSYQLCKQIYSFHPLGAKLAEIPIRLAQSKPREITVPASPGERVKEAFLKEWKAFNADRHLFNLHRLKRVYGIAALAVLEKGVEPSEPLDPAKLSGAEISINVLDPLNTAGSLVGDLDPNSPGFLKPGAIAVQGKAYHRSRSVVVTNEEPIYLEYTTSAYGYVGRSVYQRTLFPLKSFVETMVTDAMVARKAGVLVAKMKQAGSIADGLMGRMFGAKREVLKEARTDNVISIGTEEFIESLNLENVNGAMDASRSHILENIAAGAGMPAILVNSETYAEGFGEGSEDAKAVADYIDRERADMESSYQFMDTIVQRRAWTPEFYKTIQAAFPDEYGDVAYETAFYQWRNSFDAKWASLLTEPDSEKVKTDDVRLKAIIAFVQMLLPHVDPENKVALLTWAQDNLNENTFMFTSPLNLDFDALRNWEPPESQGAPDGEAAEPLEHPVGMADAATVRPLRRPARLFGRGHAAA